VLAIYVPLGKLGMAEVWWHLGGVVLAVTQSFLGAIRSSLAALVKATMAETIVAVAGWAVTIF